MASNPARVITPLRLRTEVADRLAQLRLARNVTQEALARHAGISLRTVRRLEAGITVWSG